MKQKYMLSNLKSSGSRKSKEVFNSSEEVKPPSFLQLLKFSSNKERWLMGFGIFATVLIGIVEPINRIFYGDLTQAIIEYAQKCEKSSNECTAGNQEMLEAILKFVWQFAIIGVLDIIFSYVGSEVFNYTAVKQVFRIRSLYLKSLLNKDISWYDTNTSGDFASRMADDLSKFEEGIGERIPLYLILMLSFVSSVVIAFIKGWQLSLICIVPLPVTMIFTNVISRVITKLAVKELDASAAAGAVAEEVLSAIRTVVAFGGQKIEKERYCEKLEVAKKSSIRKQLLQGIFYGTFWFFSFACNGLAFWYGVKLLLDEKDEKNPVYTPGNMITVFFSVMAGSQSFIVAAPFIELFSVAKSSGERIFKIIESQPQINLSKNKGERPKCIKGNIRLENVKFTYPSRKDVPVLQGVDLEITAGQTVALVGSSGCGKSTVLQLIQRFYDTTEGKVFVDGINIKDLDLSWYRKFIGVVGQEPVLFDTSIEENIKFGNHEATKEDIVHAAKKANAHVFIQKLPNGYQTIVGERGAQLSGGQKQRIAIARALIRNPTILLLDEATSALDTNSEAKVQAALDSASQECTTIIVAHRLSTIRNADKIIVLSNGLVVEQGTHSELMDLGKEYFALVTAQAKSDDEFERSITDRKVSLQNQDDDVVLEEQEKAVDDMEENYTDSFVKTASLWSIVKMNSPEWFFLFMGTMGATTMGCAMPIFAVLFGSILQVLQDNDSEYIRSNTNIYCIYFVATGFILMIATFLQMYMFGNAGEKLTLRLRTQMFETVLNQEMGFFDRNTNGVGALCARLASDAAQVQGATGQRIGAIMNSFAALALSLGLSLYFQWKLGLVVIAFFPFMALAIFFQRRLSFGENEGYRISLQNSTKIAVEAVSNIRTVASLGCEEKFYQLYIKELIPHVKRSVRNTHARAIVLGLSRGLPFIAHSVCMYYGGFLIRDDYTIYGNIFKVCQALIMGAGSVANSLAFTPNLDKGLKAAKNVMKLLNRIPKITDSKDAVVKDTAQGEVQYSDVSFSYPTRQNIVVLNGLDLSVLQGKTVALVGHSGCGKSTIVQLLERFYNSTSGSVRLDSCDVKNITLSSLRTHLGIVSQEPNLFSMTIKDNIAYGDNSREVMIDEIIDAAKKANIHNFIQSLPQGYETKLGEKGTQLSGGQKQRIAIARALIRNPKVLLLDEATSALDTESEKVVQEALNNAKQGRTCITIAHRLSTIQDADVIFVIDSGKVAEHGTHDELIKKRGRYFGLHSLQHN